MVSLGIYLFDDVEVLDFAGPWVGFEIKEGTSTPRANEAGVDSVRQGLNGLPADGAEDAP